MRELGDEYLFSGNPDMPQDLLDAYFAGDSAGSPTAPPDEEPEPRRREFTPWEKRLIALAVYAESSNGTYDQDAMVFTAERLLDRLEMEPWKDEPYSAWEALKGVQTALHFLYEGKEGKDPVFPLPASYGNAGWATEDDLIAWVNSSWAAGMLGEHRQGYAAALAAVEQASHTTFKGMPYFSHQRKPVQFDTLDERFSWILETAELRQETDADFLFDSYGPFYSANQGFNILLVGSNQPGCGSEGDCRPPWP